MPKGGKIRTELDALREYANSLAPQKGFFSTLDELIEVAPFERAPVTEWQNYLKPGRMLRRDEAQFPLKQEELKYSKILEILDSMNRGGYPKLPLDSAKTVDDILESVDPAALDKATLLETLRRHRPEFRARYSRGDRGGENDMLERIVGEVTKSGPMRYSLFDRKFGPERYDYLSHQTPGSTYEEAVTGYPDIQGENRWQHFQRDALSHSRTSSHQLPTGLKMRLVEEIQSDLHERARERHGELLEYATEDEKRALRDNEHDIQTLSSEIDALNEQGSHAEAGDLAKQVRELRQWRREVNQEIGDRRPRRGYHDHPDAEAEMKNLLGGQRSSGAFRVPEDEIRYDQLNAAVPDAPFKDPAEYARLELRKQLLNAANLDEDYLALTTGEDQIKRYSMDNDEVPPKSAEAMRYVYDKLNRGELEALARRYGAQMEDVEMLVGSGADLRPQIMRDVGVDDIRGLMALAQDSERSLHGAASNQGGALVKIIDELTTPNTPPDLIDQARSQLNKVRQISADYMENPDAHQTDLDYELQGYQRTLERMYNLHQKYTLESNPELRAEATRKFPALRLTPEVRERIKRLGVPLFSVAGGTAVFDDEETPMEFKEGGPVSERERQRREAVIQREMERRILGIEAPPVEINEGESFRQYVERTKKERRDRKVRYAEGGDVDRSALDDLGLAFKLLNPGLTSIGSNVSDAAQHFPHGFRTQWMGLDPALKPRGALYSDWEAPREEWTWNDEAQMALPPQRGVRPGIVNETLAIPAFFGYQGFDTSNRASENVQILDEALREEHNVPEPESWGDFLGEAGGIMGAQVPMPSGLFKGAAGALGRFVPEAVKTAGEAVRRIPGVGAATTVASSVPEFMLPTIEPSLKNYALGTGAGAVLMKYLPQLIGEEEIGTEEEDLSDVIDWTDPSLDALIQDGLDSGDLSPEEADLLLSEVAAQRARLEAPTLGESGMAKGGRVSLRSLRAKTGGKPLSVAYPINPKEDYGELTVDENGQVIDGHKRLSGLEKWADRHGLRDVRVRVKRGEYAKGGRIKPTAEQTLALRQRLEQLMSEAAVPENQQMVPVDPGSPPVSVEAGAIDPGVRLGEPSILETPVSRRTVLEGMASLASPIDPMIDVNLDGLGKAVEAPVAAAVKKTALSAPKLAAFLTDSWGHIFHGSDESAILDQADRFDQLEGGEEIAGALREWYRRMETDLPEGGYHNPANDPKDVDAALEKLNEEMDLEGQLQEFGRSRGLLVDPRGEWAEHGDMEFVEPPDIVSRNDLTGDFAGTLQDYGNPEKADAWRKVFADWGDRADAIIAEFYGDVDAPMDPKYFSEEALAKYGLDSEDLDSFMNYMEGEMTDHSNIRAWAAANPELRQRYRDVIQEYDDLSKLPEGEADRKVDSLMDRITKTLEEIYGPYEKIEEMGYVEPYDLPVGDVIHRYVPEEKWGAWTPKQHEQFGKLIKEYQGIYRMGDDADTPAIQRRAEKIVTQLEKLGFDTDSFGSDIG